MQYGILRNGISIPMLGFGVFTVEDNKLCKSVVLKAIDTGYRLIDTAAAYFNEQAVGEAIKESGIKREELFITSKLWVQDAGYENTKKAFEKSLVNLGLDYMDLYLIHQPFGDYYGSWRAMEELYKEGKIKSIGVSNFSPGRLSDLSLNAKIKPMLLQTEIHPLYQQQQALDIMRNYDIFPQAWAPLAKASDEIMRNPALINMARKYGKSVPQIVLRWNIQRGVAVVSKSVRKLRIEENFDIWDFELSENDMLAISRIDRGKSLYIDHMSVAASERFNNWKIHD